MKERWKIIPGQPNYAVSDRGRIRRELPGKGTHAGKLRKVTRSPYGYLYIDFWHDGVHTRLYVHQAVLLAFIGPKPTPRHEVAHWDGKKSNNRLKNLRWALPLGNRDDMRRHGRLPEGSKHGNAKLTESDVRLMRRLRKKRATWTLEKLGKRFGITLTNADFICRRVTWKHVA